MNRHSYKNLLSPIQVGSLTLRNRFMLPPMSYSSKDGEFSAEWMDWIERFAEGGVALITVGETNLSFRSGTTHSSNVVMTDPRAVQSLYRMADRAHMHGAAISIELSHGGALSDPKFNGGKDPMAPSTKGDEQHYKMGLPYTFVPMDEAMMNEVAEDYATAAELAKNAGFDAVQIHMGHGWLLHQFLSPLFNHRDDEYGGSLENRVRFPLMVLDRVRERVGREYPLDVRISGAELLPGGNTEHDVAKIAELLQDRIDLISISCGGIYAPETCERMSPSVFYERGVNVYCAAAVKSNPNLHIPVSTVGALDEPVELERIIAEGRADIVNLGRGLICDPQMPNKLRDGREEDVLRCIRCYHCQQTVFEDPYRAMRCSVNPRVGYEARWEAFDKPAKRAKNVVIVGGGPAGMQAALTASEKGHRVTLLEKSGKLGGSLGFCDYMPFKEDIRIFRDSMIAHVENDPGITVKLNTEATAELIDSLKPEAVIAAVGARQEAPAIPGAEGERVLLSCELFGKENEIGENIVVIGAGLTGCEEAIWLAQLGKKVTLLARGFDCAKGATFSHKGAVMRMLGELVDLRLGTKTLSIDPDGTVHCEILLPPEEDKKEEQAVAASGRAGKAEETASSGRNGVPFEQNGSSLLLRADTVILAAGMKARTPEALALRGDTENFAFIGDCKKAAKIYEATSSGFFAAQSL